MSKPQHHIDQLTPEIIQKYISGELTDRQQFEVEKLMLESPFDHDAMEGFEDSHVDLDKGLDELNIKLAKRISKKGRATHLWWRVAAAVIILGVFSYFILNISLPKKQQMVSVPENRVLPKTEGLDMPDAIEKKAEGVEIEESKEEALTEVVEENPIPPFEEEKVDRQPTKPLLIEPDAAPQLNEAIAQSNDTATKSVSSQKEITKENKTIEESTEDRSELAEPLMAEEKNVINDFSQEVTTPLSGQVAGVNKKRQRAAKMVSAPQPASETIDNKHLNTISGTVISEETGQPLPGVNIILSGTSTGTVTDIDGKYHITMDETEENPSLVFNYIGYVTTEVPIEKTSKIDVSLSEDTHALSEIVVTGYGQEQTSKSSPPTYVSARPEGGMRTFKKYLDENIQYPKNWTGEGGKVVLLFYVELDGSITNIEIKSSLGAWQDKEAIRLLKEGASWQAALSNDEPVRTRQRLVIKFEDK